MLKIILISILNHGYSKEFIKEIFRFISGLSLVIVAHAYNPSTWEVQARELKIQDYPQLYSKYEARLHETLSQKKKRGGGGEKEHQRVAA